jgi:hypothetical protein
MKRDMDLVRKILLALEGNEHVYQHEQLKIEGYSPDQVGFHMFLMMEAKLITGTEISTMDSKSPEVLPGSITWEGYEFLDNARVEKNWI